VGRLSGKVAVVTGIQKGGTGYGIAMAFLREGASVLVSDIKEEKIRESVAELEKLGPVVGCVADVMKREDADRTIRTAVEKFGQLDVLVNNAVLVTPGVELQDLDDAQIRRNLGSSLYGTIYHMQAAYPHLKRRGGSIINFGSRNGLEGAVGFSMYAAAKEGVRGLSRSVAREWGRHKIRVNVICPASLSPGAKSYFDANPEVLKRALEFIPLGYFGEGYKDIAPVAVFLASEDSHYVTGQTINVDGGQAML
jgi:NAD(P)-dependent dehydrogenase (short-subunit alcohol dehydrogenase family)